MIGHKKVLGLITARGGSKGLPGKNIRELIGKPLLAWTIDAAKQSRYIDRLVVSTDSNEIADVARRFDCDVPFLRPPELARDESSSLDVALHALDSLPGYDLLVLLQPTSPLRTTADIDGCLELCEKERAPFAISVTPVSENPYHMFTFGSEGPGLTPLVASEARPLRRQDLKPIYRINGAIYVADCQQLRVSRSFMPAGTVGYVMPQERSLDIDTPDDFSEAIRRLNGH